MSEDVKEVSDTITPTLSTTEAALLVQCLDAAMKSGHLNAAIQSGGIGVACDITALVGKLSPQG